MTSHLGTDEGDLSDSDPAEARLGGTADARDRAAEPAAAPVDRPAPEVGDSAQERLQRLAAPLSGPVALEPEPPGPVLAPAATHRAPAPSVTAPVVPPSPAPTLFMPGPLPPGYAPSGHGALAMPDGAPRAGFAASAPAPLPASLSLADVAPRRRRQWAMIVIPLVLALLIALSTYLLVTARALESRNAEWEQVARSTGQDLAKARDDLAGALAELDGTRAQLDAAQTRITELADEKAQLGDDREVQQRLVDFQSKVSDAARNVTSALTSCVDGQNKLITYLQDSASYDPADLARFRADVTRVCDSATDANKALQEVLTR
ncbi:DUF4407 domain-containing protein [Cellulomonas chengniuliangii]|uniref:DUF4407 domain-containing protein n=1 Tax=Cellulomonas chengniuliangii TaxID=2968084 RepID=UPI001D0F26D6|nr:DUF4407 domain-containing protein [Cellulomonas chengniuliangii]MCC2319124.1 DUF4407 domain-containing protein [Cellulomonas chengniuliangii]